MAEYKTHTDEKTGVTFIEITGNIAFDEQLAFMKGDSFGERTLRVITDMRNASLEDMPRGLLAKLVRETKPLSKPGITAAYLFNRGEDFSKGKLLLAQLEVLGYNGQFRIFTEMDKAISWMQEQAKEAQEEKRGSAGSIFK